MVRMTSTSLLWALALILINTVPDAHAQGFTEVTPFVAEVVDGTGDVGGGISGIVDPEARPQIAYYDATSKDLRWVIMVEPHDMSSRHGWVVERVDGLSTDVGQYPSLALDASGHPHISYYNATTGALMHATRPAAGTPWVVETVDDAGPANVGLYTSIAVGVGPDPGSATIVIAYHNATNGLLKLATKSGSGPWTTEIVDGGTSNIVGQYASLALDSENRPHIAYYDATNGNLKYAVKLGLTLPWTIEVVDGLSLDVGRYASIALSPVGPMISYYDVTNHDLKLATRLSLGWTSLSVDVTGDVGLDTSLEIDVSGEPRISYYDATNGDLRLASRSVTTWTIEAVEILGDNGRFASLSLDGYGNPIIAFYDAVNGDLKIADSSIRLEAPLGLEIWAPGSQQVVRWSGRGSVRIMVSVDGGTGLDVSGEVTVSPATIRVPNMVSADARVMLVRSTPYSASESPGPITIAPGMNDRWSRVTVDGLTSEAGGFTSLALDAAGSPRISYYTFDSYDLKYAAKLGATWAIETVDSSGDVGAYSSLALDASGNPKIAYYDYTNGNLKLATKSGGVWTLEVVDGASADVGEYPSLALDAAGNPQIAYYDVTNGNLKLATKSGSTWAIEVVDGATTDVGWYASLAGNQIGKPEIAYYDVTNADLKFAMKSGPTWTLEVVDAGGDVGRYLSFDRLSLYTDRIGSEPFLGTATERRSLAYHDQTNGDLKFAYRVSPGVWSTQIVDAVGTVGRHNSLVLDAEGRPYIAYRDVTNGSLKVAEAPNAAEGSDPKSWHIETVDASGDVGGWTSLRLDPYKNLKLSYRDIANGDLKYASTAIELGDPALGDVWPVGASRTITWDGRGPVDISLSTNGGGDWTPLAHFVHGETNFVDPIYRLIVPHTPTHFARIKVERAVPYSVSITPGFFTIETDISLLNLTAQTGNGGVLLSWNTNPGPEDLGGFRLEKRWRGGEWRSLAGLLRETSFLDREVLAGSQYRLFGVNGFGQEFLLGETTFGILSPLAAGPLPFRGGSMNINFASDGGSLETELALYDLQGRKVRTILRGRYPVGMQQVTWDGRNDAGQSTASGAYFLRLSDGGRTVALTKIIVSR